VRSRPPTTQFSGDVGPASSRSTRAYANIVDGLTDDEHRATTLRLLPRGVALMEMLVASVQGANLAGPSSLAVDAHGFHRATASLRHWGA
jgi:hypothetical protein